MGSNFFGGDHRLSSNNSANSNSSQSSSSRKGKKNGGGSDKPKQPQRGLGVAQLEKIRLHSQLGCNYLPPPPNPYHAGPNLAQEDIRLQGGYPAPPSSSFSYSSTSPYAIQGTQGVMMGFQDLDRGNIRYADSQTTNVARWHHGHGNAVFGSQQSVEPSTTRSFFEPRVEGSFINTNHWRDSMGSGSQNSEGSNSEIDLELRL